MQEFDENYFVDIESVMPPVENAEVPQKPQTPPINDSGVVTKTTKQFKFAFDKEVIQIFNNTSPELLNAMVCLSIKHFSKTETFQNYFSTMEFREKNDVMINTKNEKENIKKTVDPKTNKRKVIGNNGGW